MQNESMGKPLIPAHSLPATGNLLAQMHGPDSEADRILRELQGHASTMSTLKTIVDRLAYWRSKSL
jgi:hypothetical protein